jgi:integrase
MALGVLTQGFRSKGFAMPRRPRPWYRHDRKRPDKTGWWVYVGGRQHLLHRGGKSAADRKIAEIKFHELMVMTVAPPESPEANVASVCDAFLSWSKRSQSEETYRGYHFYIQAFCEACGYRSVAELKPYHVNRWLDERKKWNVTTRYNAIRSVLRVFNWAREEGLIAENPLHGMKRPKPNRRSRYLTDDEFAALMREAGPAFRQFLRAMDQTGARPSELRTARWDDWQGDRLVLEQHKTAKKIGKPRVIYLNSTMQKTLAEMKRDSRTSHIFTNTRGRPWTRNALRLQVHRLRRKLKLADDVCLYLARHRFGTKAAIRGLNNSTIAELMGHTSTQMVDQVYIHLAGEDRHLQEAVEQATGNRRARMSMLGGP